MAILAFFTGMFFGALAFMICVVLMASWKENTNDNKRYSNKCELRGDNNRTTESVGDKSDTTSTEN